MSSDEKSEDQQFSAAKLKELLGPPPVLSTESAEQFMRSLGQATGMSPTSRHNGGNAHLGLRRAYMGDQPLYAASDTLLRT